MLRRIGVDHVDDVEEEVGVGEFFQGGSEGGDEDGGEFLDEADGVSQEDLAEGVDVPASGDGVEGGEQLVGGEDSGAGQGVKQRTLAGVGVANEGDDGQASSAPVFPIQVAVGPDVLNLLLETVNLAADEASVGLQLGLTGAPGAYASSEPFKVFPLARESGEEVFMLGKLDLESALSGAGPGGKDVEDESGAVDNLALESVFEDPLLRGRKLVIHDNRLVAKLTFKGLDFFQFALTEIGLAGPGELLGDDADDLCTGALGELGKLVEGVLEAPEGFDASDGGSDEEGFLGGGEGGD